MAISSVKDIVVRDDRLGAFASDCSIRCKEVRDQWRDVRPWFIIILHAYAKFRQEERAKNEESAKKKESDKAKES